MKTRVTNIKLATKEITGKTKNWYHEQSRKKKIMFWFIVIAIIAIVTNFIFADPQTSEASATNKRKVTVASISSLSNSDQNFPLLGTVTSVSEATIRAESSGKLTRVYKKLGDTVFAGGVIAQFENSAEQASVLQAEGVYDQAKAAKDIAQINSGQAGSSLADTKIQALNSISNAYTTMDDAVRGKTDSAFTDPKHEQIKLIISIPDANLATSLETRRKAIEKILITREQINKSLTVTSDLPSELSAVQSEAQTIKTYLDDLFTAYSKSLPDGAVTQTQLDAGKANTQLARQAISGVLTSLITNKTTLSASVTSNQVAGGAGAGAIATADASLKQALGAYNAALARLEKTIIRSPITGTLNSLSINTGDYITAFSQVAVVSNNGALEVVSFVTEDDAKRIAVGAQVMIDGTVLGVITRIASAIDPNTKKIEVRVGIKDARSTLINGQSVHITVTKSKKDTKVRNDGPIIIPLSALKLTPRGANVFTVSASNTLIAIPVKEGAILGEQIQILEGLLGNEEIVIDARGLKEGLEVTLENN